MLVYMLLCRDGSVYTGVASDLEKRMRDHFLSTRSAAAYTRSHGARRLLAAWECEGRSLAQRAEYAIKQLTHAQKEALAASPDTLTGGLLPALAGTAILPLPPDDPRILAVRAQFEE